MGSYWIFPVALIYFLKFLWFPQPGKSDKKNRAVKTEWGFPCLAFCRGWSRKRRSEQRENWDWGEKSREDFSVSLFLVYFSGLWNSWWQDLKSSLLLYSLASKKTHKTKQSLALSRCSINTNLINERMTSTVLLSLKDNDALQFAIQLVQSQNWGTQFPWQLKKVQQASSSRRQTQGLWALLLFKV